MQAVQVIAHGEPADALSLVEMAPPEPVHSLAPGEEAVVVEVHATGVGFPELLQCRGRYQTQPELPFVLGSEVSGIVVSAPASAAVRAGDRVAALTEFGGCAELATAPASLVFALPQALNMAQGAALVFNFHTVVFALVRRGRLCAGEWVLVHGAAGGVGSAALQVARGLGAKSIAVVSSDEKERVARDAGADEVVRADGPWREQAREISGGGVDVVLDPVGGDRFRDSLRACREEGRVVVAGFAAGVIPEVRVNGLLLHNLEVIGAGWGAWAFTKPAVAREVGLEVDRLVEAGFVRPFVGARFPLEQTAAALELVETRSALGRTVIEVRA